MSRLLAPGKKPVANHAPSVPLPSTDVFNTFLNFMRAHGVILVIIILCVVVTSIIWIGVIYQIRRNDKQRFSHNNTNDDVENYSEHGEDSPDNGISRNDQMRIPHPLYSPFTELDYQDYESESSSARVSCGKLKTFTKQFD